MQRINKIIKKENNTMLQQIPTLYSDIFIIYVFNL
jgi:hypothetical protein